MIPWPQTIMIVLTFGFLFAADVTVSQSNWDNFEMFPAEIVVEDIYFERIEKVGDYYIPIPDSTYMVYTKKELITIKKNIKKIEDLSEENLEN